MFANDIMFSQIGFKNASTNQSNWWKLEHEMLTIFHIIVIYPGTN